MSTGGSELLVPPLAGAASSRSAGDAPISGRPEVDGHHRLPVRRNTFTVASDDGGRFALPASKATTDLPVRYCPASEVVTTLRGAGNCSRQVNNYALGNALNTSHLLACEVLTPGGNWSSYPPHKHDEHNDVERVLEEIYYYEVRPAANGTTGMAIQRIYPSPGKPIDVCAEVHSRDVVIMPTAITPLHRRPVRLYYLNVMAARQRMPPGS